MKLQFLQTILESNFIKFFNMKKQPTKRVFCIETKDQIIRYVLCESKYEAIQRIMGQDDYKHPHTYYKVTTK